MIRLGVHLFGCAPFGDQWSTLHSTNHWRCSQSSFRYVYLIYSVTTVLTLTEKKPSTSIVSITDLHSPLSRHWRSVKTKTIEILFFFNIMILFFNLTVSITYTRVKQAWFWYGPPWQARLRVTPPIGRLRSAPSHMFVVDSTPIMLNLWK